METELKGSSHSAVDSMELLETSICTQLAPDDNALVERGI